jgi:hypothetical protein
VAHRGEHIDRTADAQHPACAPRCADCRHRAEHRQSLEQSIPGLAVFSSGFGASVADSRLCRLHDQLVSPGDSCAQFEACPLR